MCGNGLDAGVAAEGKVGMSGRLRGPDTEARFRSQGGGEGLPHGTSIGKGGEEDLAARGADREQAAPPAASR